MLDGIKLEHAGIPAVSIVTQPFIATGQAMAETWGAPDYAFVVTPHPIANLSPAELDARAEELTDQVVAFMQRSMDRTREREEAENGRV